MVLGSFFPPPILQQHLRCVLVYLLLSCGDVFIYSDWVLQLLQVKENPQIDGLFPKCFFQPMGLWPQIWQLCKILMKRFLMILWTWESRVFYSITVSTIQSKSAHVPAPDPKASPFEIRRMRPRNLYLKAVWSSGCCGTKKTLLIYRATSFTCFCTCVGQLFFEILWNWHKFSWWDAMHQHPSECLLIPTSLKSLQGVYIYTGKRPGGSGTMHLKTSRGQSMWVTGKVTSSTAKLSRTPSEVKDDPKCMVRFATNNELYP